jgi:hypothetical protein
MAFRASFRDVDASMENRGAVERKVAAGMPPRALDTWDAWDMEG